MDKIIEKTEAFLNSWHLGPDSIDMDQYCSQFLQEMDAGLAGKNSSLAMIPSYTTTEVSIQPGSSVIVLDAGGTNFRTCLVTFDEELVPHISHFKKCGMPGVKHETSAQEFFKILANEVEPLIDLSDHIGFCFSYAAKITADHDGIPIVFSKEIKAPEVIGMPVGASLLNELAVRGHNITNKKVAVVNDTVATLLAGKAAAGTTAYGGFVGFILGTGTNTAYVEKNSKITKAKINSNGSQIINVESGNFDLIVGPLDKRFIDSTKNPDDYHFEKVISGAYLGKFAHLVVSQAIEEQILSERFSKLFATITPLDTTRMSHYLEMPNNKEYDLVKCITNEEDATALYVILDAVIASEAKLTAVNLSAAVLKS